MEKIPYDERNDTELRDQIVEWEENKPTNLLKNTLMENNPFEKDSIGEGMKEYFQSLVPKSESGTPCHVPQCDTKRPVEHLSKYSDELFHRYAIHAPMYALTKIRKEIDFYEKNVKQ